MGITYKEGWTTRSCDLPDLDQFQEVSFLFHLLMITTVLTLLVAVLASYMDYPKLTPRPPSFLRLIFLCSVLSLQVSTSETSSYIPNPLSDTPPKGILCWPCPCLPAPSLSQYLIFPLTHCMPLCEFKKTERSGSHCSAGGGLSTLLPLLLWGWSGRSLIEEEHLLSWRCSSQAPGAGYRGYQLEILEFTICQDNLLEDPAGSFHRFVRPAGQP